MTYMVGPIDKCPNGGVQWRKDLTPWLEEKNIVVLDPNNKPFLGLPKEESTIRGEIQILKLERKFQEIKDKFGYIRTCDLRMVDKADFIIARMDSSIPTCGSYEEIFWANRMKHPVLYWQTDGLENVPNWIIFTLPPEHIFLSLAELKDYLNRVDQGLEPSLNRWYFYE